MLTGTSFATRVETALCPNSRASLRGAERGQRSSVGRLRRCDFLGKSLHIGIAYSFVPSHISFPTIICFQQKHGQSWQQTLWFLLGHPLPPETPSCQRWVLGAYRHTSRSKDFTFNSCILQSNFKSKAWAQHPQIQLPLLNELSGKKQMGAGEERGRRKGQGELGGPRAEMPMELRSCGVTGPGQWSLLSARQSTTHNFLINTLILTGDSRAVGVEHYLYMALRSVPRRHFNPSSKAQRLCMRSAA